jgi:hypothetical protein
MKSNFSFLLVTGVCVGTALGMTLNNMPMCIHGRGSGMLVLLSTLFEKDVNK